MSIPTGTSPAGEKLLSPIDNGDQLIKAGNELSIQMNHFQLLNSYVCVKRRLFKIMDKYFHIMTPTPG